MRVAQASALLVGLVLLGDVAAAPVTTLYAHPVGGAGSGIVLQFFEMADDFVVPAGQTWTITSVREDGFATVGRAMTVTFYANSGSAPGSALCARAANTISSGSPFELQLASPCVLSAGTYWVGIRPQASGASGQHNTTPNIVGANGKIKDVFTTFCGTSFVNINACFAGAAQDLRFDIRGCTAATCEIPIQVQATCSGNNLSVAILAGDGPFNITGTGTGLPINGVAASTQNVAGPNLWQSVAVVETGGDTQSLSLGNFNCGTPATTLTQSGGTTVVDEGNPSATDSYTIALAASPDPSELVTITPSFDAVLGVTVAPGNMQFNTSNWNVPQTFTVTVVDDFAFEGPHTSNITHSLSSTLPRYTGVTVPNVSVSITDDETELTFEDGFE